MFALTASGDIFRGQSCVRRPFWSQMACWAQVGPGHFGHRNPDLWTQFVFGPSICFLHLSVKSLILEPHIFQTHRVLPLETQFVSKLNRNWVHGFRDSWVQRQHTQTNWVHKANWAHKTNLSRKANWVHRANWVHDSIVCCKLFRAGSRIWCTDQFWFELGVMGLDPGGHVPYLQQGAEPALGVT